MDDNTFEVRIFDDWTDYNIFGVQDRYIKAAIKIDKKRVNIIDVSRESLDGAIEINRDIIGDIFGPDVHSVSAKIYSLDYELIGHGCCSLVNKPSLYEKMSSFPSGVDILMYKYSKETDEL